LWLHFHDALNLKLELRRLRPGRTFGTPVADAAGGR
jgi:hypothetical protein